MINNKQQLLDWCDKMNKAIYLIKTNVYNENYSYLFRQGVVDAIVTSCELADDDRDVETILKTFNENG